MFLTQETDKKDNFKFEYGTTEVVGRAVEWKPWIRPWKGIQCQVHLFEWVPMFFTRMKRQFWVWIWLSFVVLWKVFKRFSIPSVSEKTDSRKVTTTKVVWLGPVVFWRPWIWPWNDLQCQIYLFFDSGNRKKRQFKVRIWLYFGFSSGVFNRLIDPIYCRKYWKEESDHDESFKSCTLMETLDLTLKWSSMTIFFLNGILYFEITLTVGKWSRQK